MSHGENINVNGAELTQDMIRAGFFRFPQTDVVMLNPANWNQIIPLLVAANYPFTAEKNDLVPAGEVWYINRASMEQWGRIVGLAYVPHGTPTSMSVSYGSTSGHIATTGSGPRKEPPQTQNDALDFLYDEENKAKTQEQIDRRLKDGLL